MAEGSNRKENQYFPVVTKDTYVIGENNIENCEEMKSEISPPKRIVVFVL